MNGTSESDAYWSAGENWEGNSAPSGGQSIETLTFPHLTNGACTSEPPSDTCYLTLNDLSGLSVEALNIDDAEDYLLAGEGITLGSGGLTASPGTTQVAGTFLEMPITLGSSQHWSIANGSRGGLGENGVALEEPVTGQGKSLAIELRNDPALIFTSSTEVGPLTISGANPSQAGIFNGVVDLFGANVNASNGQPVALNHIFAIGYGALGALTMNAGVLVAGVGYPAKGIEATGVKLDSASRLGFEISGGGTSARTDYSQLSSSGVVELEDAAFEVTVRPPKKGQPCPVLSPGQTYTFLSTTGSLVGSFGNAPEGGSEIPIEFAEACGAKSQTMRISYNRSGSTEAVTGIVEAAVKERQEKEASEAKQKEELLHKIGEENARRVTEEANKKRLEEAAGTKKHEEELAAVAAKHHQEEEVIAAATRHEEEVAATSKKEEEAAGKGKSKPLTRAQKLAKALKQCKKQPKKKQARCKAKAEKLYGPKPKKHKGIKK